ncbi:MAG: response regulator [Gallionella sp.]|nr:response regulator [Gallionella sp.]
MNVLVVDDTQINVTLVAHLIAKLDDCDATSFIVPQQGLDWCVEQVPDLVVVDYMMPGLDGIEFIRRFRSIPGCEDIPLLMVTANDQTEVRHRALEAGANDFLTKPIDKTEFTMRARNMLALRRSQRRLGDHALWLEEEVGKATASILAREREMIFRLCKAAESRDPETGAHILRMAHYSKLIAARLGWAESEQEMLLEAAPMHDIGKVGVPDNILLKPGKLDEAEFAIIKTHAQHGYDILKGSESEIMRMGAEIALTHHEKFDGSGYPSGLRGEDIPWSGRICAVADVFDALTCERPYKKAWELDRAAAFLRENTGTHFDPACVEAFLTSWEEAVEIRNRFRDEGGGLADA